MRCRLGMRIGLIDAQASACLMQHAEDQKIQGQRALLLRHADLHFNLHQTGFDIALPLCIKAGEFDPP